jgi:hypothetical protein
MTPHTPPPRNGEQGIAILIALFMMLALSVLGTSLMFVSKTETLSSHNYRLMSQARYGAESGIHKAANYLMSSGYGSVMPGTAGDALTNYDLTTSPVKWGGNPVVLSSTAASSNYPVASVKTAFAALFSGSGGTLDVGDAPVTFTATATLKSMRQITDATAGTTVVIQSWELAGQGSIAGARNATVEVSSVMERQTTPIYAYAAFATYSGCAALDFAGGAQTNSYDSTAALSSGAPVLTNDSGNVGTNGNLKEVGNSTAINGTLSTPRAGVGTCSDVQNVTALTQSGGATVSGGLVQLSQAVSYPTPATPSPLPPTTATDFKKNTGCPSGFATYCATSTNGATYTPPSASTVITLGNVTMNAGAIVHLNAGIYVINSLSQNGNAQIIVDSGPVVIQVAGVGQTTPVTINGNGLVNTTQSGGFKPENLQISYAGTGTIKMNGGSGTSALIYAPNADVTISGGGDLYGALVAKTLSDTGGAAIHYDRRLKNSTMTAGNYLMSAFTWKNY